MNLPYNSIFQKITPYLFVILTAYVISTIFSFYLPKNGVHFVGKSSASFSYKKYEGFYSTVVSKTQNINKKIEKQKLLILSKYQLKAVYSTSSNAGWAIIQRKSSNKSTILEQYQKFNGYTLTRLYTNYVVFEKNLKEFKIELPTNTKMSYEIKNSSRKENIIVDGNSVIIKRKHLNSYVNDLNKVWKDIAISDIRKNGKIDGFKVNRVNKTSIFGKLGLKKNDVIKGINGKIITSYADAFKIYNEINNLEYLSIEVLRNNEIVELNYEIE
jgi:general secretion pathway protein C